EDNTKIRRSTSLSTPINKVIHGCLILSLQLVLLPQSLKATITTQNPTNPAPYFTDPEDQRWGGPLIAQGGPSAYGPSSSSVESVICPSLAYANTLFFKSAYNVQVIVDDNEPEERLLNRFRREVMRAGVIQETKRRRYFENKQDEKKRRTRDAAKRNKRSRRPFSRPFQQKPEVPETKRAMMTAITGIYLKETYPIDHILNIHPWCREALVHFETAWNCDFILGVEVWYWVMSIPTVLVKLLSGRRFRYSNWCELEAMGMQGLAVLKCLPAYSDNDQVIQEPFGLLANPKAL
ncbi:Ribosomal protein S21 family protein, partial [Prunus dulcis]